MYEHVRKATEALAAGRGPVKERLEAAAIEIAVVMLEPDGLPEELRPLARDIDRQLNATEPRGDGGSIRASIVAMNEAEASRIAGLILDLYGRYERQYNAIAPSGKRSHRA